MIAGAKTGSAQRNDAASLYAEADRITGRPGSEFDASPAPSLHASNHVILTVSDTGPGFAGAKLESIFDAFYTTKPEGMGIGLAVSRSIIEAHGGRLWATPNEPRGALLQFTLPACGQEAQ